MKFLYYLSLFLIPIIVYLFSGLLFIYLDGFYNIVGDSPSIAEMNHQVFSYIRGTGSELPAVFQEKEIAHLRDVRIFVLRMQALFLFSIIIAGISLFQFDWRKTLRKSSIGIFILGGIFIISALFFRYTFDLFHKIFFRPDTYSFSSDYLLINIYPFSYFLSSFVTIIFFSLCIGVLFYYHPLALSLISNIKSKLFR